MRNLPENLEKEVFCQLRSRVCVRVCLCVRVRGERDHSGVKFADVIRKDIFLLLLFFHLLTPSGARTRALQLSYPAGMCAKFLPSSNVVDV